MDIAKIKAELHYKIDNADTEQLKQIYGLIINYMAGNCDDLNILSDVQKEHILKGLEQAEAGLGRPLKEINKGLHF